MYNLAREILNFLKLLNKSNYLGSQDFLKTLTYNIMPLADEQGIRKKSADLPTLEARLFRNGATTEKVTCM